MKIHISYTYGCPDETILRELMSYDIQCPECTILEPHENAPLNFEVPTSFTSLHWSRQYEYPWAIMHSNLKPSDVCLDAGGAYAVFKYAVAKRCAKVVTIDMNQDYLDKSIRSAERLGFKNIEFHNSKIQDYKTEEKFDNETESNTGIDFQLAETEGILVKYVSAEVFLPDFDEASLFAEEQNIETITKSVLPNSMNSTFI